jgi:hypothetical protein
MEEEPETALVHDLGPGKREGHADKVSQAVAQGIVPPLRMPVSPLSFSLVPNFPSPTPQNRVKVKGPMV